MPRTQVILPFFIDMDGIIIDGILLPKELIIDDDKLVGYTMDYFQNSMNLYDFFTYFLLLFLLSFIGHCPENKRKKKFETYNE